MCSVKQPSVHPELHAKKSWCANLCGFAEADGPGLKTVQLIKDTIYWHVGDEVIHVVIFVSQPALFWNNGLRWGEAVVCPADAITIAYR